MSTVLAYLVLTFLASCSIIVIWCALSARNAYRTDGNDNLGGALRRWADERVEAHREIARGYALRAEQQNQMILRGDPAGIYGDYPPGIYGDYLPGITLNGDAAAKGSARRVASATVFIPAVADVVHDPASCDTCRANGVAP